MPSCSHPAAYFGRLFYLYYLLVIIMPRKAKPSDFRVDVEGVGSFVFGRRTMRDEVDIQVAFARQIDGVIPTVYLESLCGWIAVLQVLTVSAPADWDIDELDPLDNNTYKKLSDVYDALCNKELSFRTGTKETSETNGA